MSVLVLLHHMYFFLPSNCFCLAKFVLFFNIFFQTNLFPDHFSFIQILLTTFLAMFFLGQFFFFHSPGLLPGVSNMDSCQYVCIVVHWASLYSDNTIFCTVQTVQSEPVPVTGSIGSRHLLTSSITNMEKSNIVHTISLFRSERKVEEIFQLDTAVLIWRCHRRHGRVRGWQ